MRAEDNICSKPFRRIEIFGNGDVHICCPDWLPHKIGNVFENSIEEIWNSSTAQEIRREMLDGNYNKCLVDKCPFLANQVQPVMSRTNITDSILREAVEKDQVQLPHLPLALKCSYDESCNLACPSCRKDFFQLNAEDHQYQKIMQINEQVERLLPHLEELHITGSGDPIGSRIYRNLIHRLDPKKYPNLKVFLYTNGLLFNRNYWESLGDRQQLIHLIEVSVDAARSDTYAINRKGGDFDKLVDNLHFISEIRSKKQIEDFGLNFTVQENNYKEMASFIELGQSLNVDLINFTRLLNWGTYSQTEYHQRDICNPQHQKYDALCRELENPLFVNEVVNTGNLTS